MASGKITTSISEKHTLTTADAVSENIYQCDGWWFTVGNICYMQIRFVAAEGTGIAAGSQVFLNLGTLPVPANMIRSDTQGKTTGVVVPMSRNDCVAVVSGGGGLQKNATSPSFNSKEIFFVYGCYVIDS